jgi:hypothetical protein
MDATRKVRSYVGLEVRNGEFAEPIRITREGVSHTLTEAGDDLLLAATHLPDLIRTARKTGEPRAPADPAGKDRNVRRVHTLTGTLLIDEDRFMTVIQVKETHQGQLFYDLGLVQKGGGSRSVALRNEGVEAGRGSQGAAADPNIGDATKPRNSGVFRIRERAGGDFEVEFVLTDAFVGKARQLTARLRRELDRLGLADVGLRVSESITAIVGGERFAADGQYFRDLIDIALGAADPDATLHHEAVHAMRRMGLFTDTEWAVLSRKSRAEWIDRFDIARKVRFSHQ